jgi:vacuolar protein sorting-associated protein 54
MAEARTTVGLKTITAKHLALASESLRLAMSLTLCFQSRLEPLLASSQRTLLAGFNAISADLEQHRCDIVTKLVAIMEGAWARARPVRETALCLCVVWGAD